jgi:small subunit ribosomal protein S5
LIEKVVHIGRVTKVVKGGRIFKFAAIVIVGDMKGRVGIGDGKAKEVPDAIRKALDNAKKNIINLPVTKGTIPHSVMGKFGAARILMKPAAPGTGIIAGGVARALFELGGINNILAKAVGSRNPNNILYAVMDGLKLIRKLEQVAAMRNVDINKIINLNREA